MVRPVDYFIIVFVMMIWGLNVVAIKVLIEDFPPITMQGFRIFLSGLVILLFIWNKRLARNLSFTEWKSTLAAGFLGITGHHFFLALGLQHTTASNAGIILALIPLTTSILSAFFLKDKLTAMRITGIVLGFIGVSFVVLNNSGKLGTVSLGDVFIFIAMVSQAFSFIIIKRTTNTLDSRLMTGIMLISGSLFLLLASFFVNGNGVSGMAIPDVRAWTIFIFSAVVATGIGQLLYNGSIQKIGPSKTTIFNNLMPFFALVGSILFLNETISWFQIAGFMFIITGVILGSGYLDERMRNGKGSDLTYPDQSLREHGKDIDKMQG